MKSKTIVGQIIDALNPKRRAGAVPTVTPCPYCGTSLSQTGHAAHRAGCQDAFRYAPPQPAEFDQDSGGGYNRNGTFPQT